MRVALLVDAGFQDAEVIYPMYRLQEAGLDVDLVGREAGRAVQGKYGYNVTADVAIKRLKVKDHDAVVVPGGYAPGVMRPLAPFVEAVADASRRGLLIAAICHGPQLLIEADVVKGRHMTSYVAVRKDLENAGADWTDDAVVVDAGGPMVTSRNPDDLPAFCQAILDVLGAGTD